MSKYIVDIHGDIEGDYEIIKKYEEQQPCDDAVSRQKVRNKMNIKFVGIDGLGGHEVKRMFSKLTDFDFIKSVGIREFNNSCGEVLNIYDVTIEIKPYRDDVSIHIFDNSIYIVVPGCEYQAKIYIDRSAYERLEII